MYSGFLTFDRLAIQSLAMNSQRTTKHLYASGRPNIQRTKGGKTMFKYVRGSTREELLCNLENAIATEYSGTSRRNRRVVIKRYPNAKVGDVMAYVVWESDSVAHCTRQNITYFMRAECQDIMKEEVESNDTQSDSVSHVTGADSIESDA